MAGSMRDGGFYYDLQKNNRLMAVTLHYNARKNGNTWDEVPNKDPETGYSKDALFTAILNEDFTVGISNTWDDFSGGNEISNFWNSIKPMAPYVSFVGEKLKKMESVADSDSFDGKVANFFKKGVEVVNRSGILDTAAKSLNNALVVQGTRFSYYGGTGVSFGNLGMKFTIFADWLPEGNGYVYKTVYQQLKDSFPYFMGTYTKMELGSEIKELNDIANQFMGWQEAPGGFQANLETVDTVQKGTLMLKLGGYYKITNLVVSDVQLTLSKQMTKNPTQENSISPLFCDIMLTLKPATKYSDISLRTFISGGDIEKGGTGDKELTDEMKSSMAQVRSEMISATAGGGALDYVFKRF